MIVKRLSIAVLVSLLLFQGWSVVSAATMESSLVVAEAAATMSDSHECCDDAEQSPMCESHCYSGVNASLTDNVLTALVLQLSPKPIHQPAKAPLNRITAVYRPPIF